MLEDVLRRDRAIITAGLAGIVVLAWLYLLHVARGMAAEMAEIERHAAMGMLMPQMHGWSAVDVALLFVMWTVMMVAMMVPSAAPMILVFGAIHRRRREARQPTVPVAVFVAGYLVVWAAYAAAATLAQWGLHAAALLSASMATTSAVLGGVILVAAGIFQWTPLKRICLANCRSPLSFLMTRWREGARGAFTMGIDHGIYCVGCCWMLMAILFVAGVMNLAWVAAVGIVVLLEKVVPGGERIGRLAGVALVIAGLLMIGSAWRANDEARPVRSLDTHDNAVVAVRYQRLSSVPERAPGCAPSDQEISETNSGSARLPPLGPCVSRGSTLGRRIMAWNVSGQLLELCNCNVVCGCWFGPTKPDQGWCGGALIFDIRQGTADGVNLSGSKVALAAEWPGDFWSGNGKARLYVDAGADQRRELEAIFGGKRGGVPQDVLGGVISQWLTPRSVKIDVQHGDATSATVGDVGRVSLKRLKDGAGKQTKVQGAAAQGAFQIDSMDIASSKGSRWSDPELRGWEGDSGNIMAFGWQG